MCTGHKEDVFRTNRIFADELVLILVPRVKDCLEGSECVPVGGTGILGRKYKIDLVSHFDIVCKQRSELEHDCLETLDVRLGRGALGWNDTLNHGVNEPFGDLPAAQRIDEQACSVFSLANKKRVCS